MSSRHAYTQRRGVPEQVVSQPRDQLWRRHHGDEVARPPFFHQSRGDADVERSGLHQVFAQRRHQVRRHVVDVRLDQRHAGLAFDPLADPHRERVARSFAGSDAVTDRSKRHRWALKPGTGGEDGGPGGGDQLEPCVGRLENRPGSFEDADAGRRRERHVAQATPRRG